MLYIIAKILLKPIFFIIYNISVEGINNIPESEGYIVCGNHTRAVDPILLGLAFPSQIHFMAKHELFNNKFLKILFNALGAFPIKRGKPDLKSIKTSLKLLKEEKNIGIFPEGTRNKTNELKAEPGIAMLSIKSKASIVPVAIKTNYKLFNKTKIIIGDIINLNEFFDKKLKNDDYINISIGIMKKIKELQEQSQ